MVHWLRTSSFWRVLRQALSHRFTLAMSIVCALGVAGLWGGNFGALYPVLQVVFQGRDLPAYFRGEIQTAEKNIKELTAAQADLEKRIAAAEPAARRKLQAEHAQQQSRLDIEQRAAATYQTYLPYIDRYAPTGPMATVVLMIGLILAGTVIKDVLIVANSVLVARLSESTTFNLRKQFYRRTLRMDTATFNNEGTSDLISRFTNDLNQLSAGLNALFGKMVREPLKGIACLVGAGWICWRLLLLSLIIAPPAALAIRWLAKKLKRANRRAMEEMSQIYSTLDETLRGIKVVKAFTMERYERRRFHQNSKRYLARSLKIALYDALAHPITEVMGIGIVCLAVLAGASMVIHGDTHLFGIPISDRPLNIYALMVFYALLAAAADPARKLSEVLARIQQAAAASERIFAMLDREPAVQDPPKALPLSRHRQSLVFDRVQFSYQPGKPVLRDVDLDIRFGETIAIVGGNGSGKSTLLNLIPRFADPTGGSVRLDGRDLREVRIRDVRRQIGIVTQETLLFDDTVLNNIRYGSPHASRAEVVEAARQAYAHRFIEEQLPDGYDTLVGQGGSRLSGGQRQRLALARAILRDPAIMLLDEATSQVDLESEQLIQKALERFVANRTTIIITHRLAVLAMADRIVVMDEGRVVDVGTHQQLWARCALYGRLHQLHGETVRHSA